MPPIITPVDKPSAISDGNKPSQAQQDARARAIARLSGNAPAPAANPAGGEAPKPPGAHPADFNQNSVSPENLGAIRDKSGQSDKTEVESDKTSAPEPSSDEPLSPQYAILARKEKALRAKAQQQEQAYKAKEAALQAREEALKAKEAKYDTDYVPKDKLQNDTWGTLQELGYTYDQLTEMALNQPQETPAQRAAYQRLQTQIKQLEDAQKKIESDTQEKQTRAYQQAVEQIRSDANKLVEADSVKYEAIKNSGTVNEVVSLIERTFNEDGVLMTVEEAADMVEEYLVDQATKYAQFAKVKKRLEAAKPAAPKQDEAPNAEAQQQPVKTLNNSMGTTRKLSPRERAMLAFKGELKN